jgi:dihydroflavonol-4-reductase
VLARELLVQGEKVRVLVLPGEDTKSLDGLDIEMVPGNVLDKDALRAAMQGVDVVFHLAALVSITEDQASLLDAVNVEGTRNVIEVAKEMGVREMIYTSSIHALERPPHGVSINETLAFDPLNPAGPYDRTKAQASLLVKAASKEGLDTRIICPTGVVGPYDFRRSEMGELILTWMKSGPHFMVAGAFDFVDVRDVARGQILARDNGKPGETYILAAPGGPKGDRKEVANDHFPATYCQGHRSDGRVLLQDHQVQTQDHALFHRNRLQQFGDQLRKSQEGIRL